MASLPGYNLEDFIRDAFSYPTEEDYTAQVKRFEPVREYIEFALLEEYGEETHSWRDFRNALLRSAEAKLAGAIDNPD